MKTDEISVRIGGVGVEPAGVPCCCEGALVVGESLDRADDLGDRCRAAEEVRSHLGDASAAELDVAVAGALVGSDVGRHQTLHRIDRRHPLAPEGHSRLRDLAIVGRTAAASVRPKRTSSFENPKVKPSFWSISVTRTSSATVSDGRRRSLVRASAMVHAPGGP